MTAIATQQTTAVVPTPADVARSNLVAVILAAATSITTTTSNIVLAIFAALRLSPVPMKQWGTFKADLMADVLKLAGEQKVGGPDKLSTGLFDTLFSNCKAVFYSNKDSVKAIAKAYTGTFDDNGAEVIAPAYTTAITAAYKLARGQEEGTERAKREPAAVSLVDIDASFAKIAPPDAEKAIVNAIVLLTNGKTLSEDGVKQIRHALAVAEKALSAEWSAARKSAANLASNKTAEVTRAA